MLAKEAQAGDKAAGGAQAPKGAQGAQGNSKGGAEGGKGRSIERFLEQVKMNAEFLECI